MVDKQLILDHIDIRIQYLKDNVITDGVHCVSISEQVIDLLNSIKEFINNLE